jgi:hypothetical protein
VETVNSSRDGQQITFPLEAINDFTNDSANPMMMVDKATKDAQRWNDLLAITGGALEIPKS